MARSLYDLGDRTPDRDSQWLNERQERRARVVPIGMVLVAFACAALAATVLKDVVPAPGSDAAKDLPSTISDHFTLCDDLKGDACVLSADSYAWHGSRYHLSDIRVPSSAEPRCPAEARRAQAARIALATMMNGGAFEARPDPADTDRTARLLLRDGVSLGQLMVLKGHAQPWSSAPIDWCGA
ncbi:nuclease [Sphingobium ummariense]